MVVVIGKDDNINLLVLQSFYLVNFNLYLLFSVSE